MHWALLGILQLAPVIAERSQADLDTCSLDGQGNLDRCEKIYWRSRVIAAVLPSYTFATDGRHAYHGLTWNLSVDIPRDFWASYFTLGAKAAPPPPSSSAFQLNAGVSFAWFPASGEVVGRLMMRMRVLSLGYPNSPALSFLHFSFGLGGYVNRDGPGPRIELKTRVGHVAWGGLTITVGYQPNVLLNRHVGDIAVGFEAPWMWWW